MEKFSVKFMTANYIIALLIIASLTIISHCIIAQSNNATTDIDQFINLSGKQRMLSQRILSEALQYERGNKEALIAMKQSEAQFQDNHRNLLLAISANNFGDEFKSYYLVGERSLDSKVHQYLSLVSKYQYEANNKESRNKILNDMITMANTDLLMSLDNAVTLFVNKSDTLEYQIKKLQNIILGVILFTLLLEAVGIFRPMIKKIKEYIERITFLATTDYLTKTKNRFNFIETCKVIITKLKTEDETACLLMLDIDHFKAINDNFGHSVGDLVLKSFSSRIQGFLRKDGVFGRLGGEEFAILLPRISIQDADAIAKRLCEEIANMDVSKLGCQTRVTVSIGVAVVFDDIDAALNSADKLLYKAKTKRNCVVSEAEYAPS